MVSIYSTPYIGVTNNINFNPVYNGLPFVLFSNRIQAYNYKYICEIFFNGQKVTELRHNPDISYGRKGVFDVGRVIENYLTFSNYSLEKFGSYNGQSSVSLYFCQFGEEYSRMMKVTGANSQSGKLLIGGQWDWDSVAGDFVYIGESGVTSYNGFKKVLLKPGSMTLQVDTPYTTYPNITNMYAIQGHEVTGFGYETVNGVQYLTVKISVYKEQYYNIGDRIIIDSPQSPTSLSTYYKNTEWTITNKYTVTGSLVLVTNCPYKYTIGASIKGAVMSKDPFVFKNQISTNSNRSHAWNGVRQYEDEFLLPNGNKSNTTWQSFYQKSLTNTDSYFKNFSDRPSKVVSVCPGEVYQLQSMGSWLNGMGTRDKRRDTHIRLETWGTDTSTGNGTLSYPTGVTNVFGSVSITLTGNVSANWGVGDYITIVKSGQPIPATGRIVRVRVVSGNTVIDTNILPSLYGTGTGSITSTIRVRYYDTLLQAFSQVIPCGPWNISAQSGVIDWKVYKYFVYPIQPTTGSYYSPTGGVTTNVDDDNGTNFQGTRPTCGERWEFNIDFSCCNNNIPTYKVMWLNKKGGFDFYKFKKRSDTSYKIERTQYDKKLSNIQGNNYYGYRSGQRGTQDYNVRSRENLVINSDFLSQAELDWLINIYESPEVYIVKETIQTTANGSIGTPYLIPVNVKNDEVQKHNKKFRKDDGSSLYTYQLELEVSVDRVLQRGGGDNIVRFYTKSLYE